MQKQIQLKIKGMQRDLSASAFNPEYAYENKNIRIMSTNENTLFSIVNEKGNKLANINNIGDCIKGVPIGQSIIDNELIIFTTGNDAAKIEKDIAPTVDIVNDITSNEFTIDIDADVDDRIYKLWFNGTTLTGTRLYKGQLNFDYKYPIETISFYENQEIKKVYWTDGLNQPRVINIAAASDVASKWNNNSFDFIRKLKLQEIVTINRNIVANGTLSPGVIQYAFTYFSKNGQESNIFYTSPLYYISYNNRGASPEDKVGNSFNILIDNIDNSFDYVRIYSIHRTSIDSVPTVKRVIDLLNPIGASLYSMVEWHKNASIDDIEVGVISQSKLVKLSSITPDSTAPDSKSWYLLGSTYDYIKFSDKDYLKIDSSKTAYINVTNSGTALIYYTDRTEMTVHLYTRGKISYIDNGSSGDIIDPTELLYVGGEEVIFGTLSQKDNTLFLGDITLKRKIVDNTIRNFLKEKKIIFTNVTSKYLLPPQPYGYYSYDNQLKFNSYRIKTFKYLETYRFGVQFQHANGKWSEPIWINDARNTQHVQCSYTKGSFVYLPTAYYVLNNQSIINKLVNEGYKNVRPVIVYPSLQDRECICQGILCPTVFNVGDRYNNSPFVQSSWFVRANAPFDEYRSNQDGGDWRDREENSLYPTINSRAGVLGNRKVTIHGSDGDTIMELPTKGAWAEFRHMHPIPSNISRNAEIQCIYNPPSSPNISNTLLDEDVNNWVSENNENFYIDQSIITLHSPDIEFDNNVRSIDYSNLQLRIVGMVPLTAFAGDIDIQTSTPANNFQGSSEVAPGFYKEHIGSENISRFGWRGLMSGAFWFDELSDYKDTYSNSEHYSTGFVVYPFHRNGSLNNKKWETDGYRPAMLDKKKISNLRFSYNTYFLDPGNIYNFYNKESEDRTGISGIAVFDSNEVSLVRLPAQKNSGLGDINYYGNVDKVINISRTGSKKDGYPIIVTGRLDASTKSHQLFTNGYLLLNSSNTNQNTGTDPIRMKYKSTPHAVAALNFDSSHHQWILPTIKDGNVESSIELWNTNSIEDIPSSQHAFWDKKKTCTGIRQDVLNIPLYNLNNSYNGYSIEYGWLWLGEIYNPEVTNRFGGQTEEAFENNQWLPCGDPISLIDSRGNIKDTVTITWTEGDTYYQRYDHLKTYPFTLEDQNAITDIVSFMCETRINLDGRYDRNRGQISNFAVTPTNFNLINDVYSQQNNFFNYRGVIPNRLNLDKFSNSITWTKTKTAGELVDTWTNITLASTLDLDGDKGRIRGIKRFNNSLIAFQDRGISQILYNENMQISSTEGIPIEIANSGKVSGKRYLSDKIGCANKWSICETPNGIYFIDDITKGIFLLSNKLDNLSDKLGFHSWMNTESTDINIWNPIDFKGVVTYYDKINGDVLFISKDKCLAFSEPISQFTSFYSYEHMPYFANIKDRRISINDIENDRVYKVWLHNEGDYNMFFGKYQPFYTTIIANPDMSTDKIFNNIEFRADSWNGDTLLNTTFDTLTTWNEYQTGIANLNNILGGSSNLKKKFRIWRANIPRDKVNGRDRMRNPWLYIKLSMEGENTNKTILHDLVVHYFE